LFEIILYKTNQSDQYLQVTYSQLHIIFFQIKFAF
jgi:hypothetical protein